MKIELTHSADLFDKLQVPTCELEYITDTFDFPRHLDFNRTYYKLYENKLLAFRILAYAVYSRLTTSQHIGISFLVQFPNEQPRWINDFLGKDSKIFESKEDFLEHQITGDKSVYLDWSCSTYVFRQLKGFNSISFEGKVYAWSNSRNCPTNNFKPTFTRFLVTQDTLFVQIKKYKSGYDKTYFTKEECVRDKIDGIEIVEFAEEPIEMNITILPNTKVTHTLRFIEE